MPCLASILAWDIAVVIGIVPQTFVLGFVVH